MTMTITITIMSFSITFVATLIKLANAANYTVGGTNGGWDTSTDLQTWSSSQSFLVGDNLIFQYAQNHNLLQVTKSDFDSCQTSNPIESHNDGNTLIPLTSPGKIYFICGAIGHCVQGMKLQVDTLATATTLLPPSPVDSPAQGSAPNLAQGSTPTGSPANSPPPNDTLPPPPLSSAYQTTLSVGLSIALVAMLHAL